MEVRRLLLCYAVCSLCGVATGIECYTGLKVIAGMSVGTQTIRCENSNAFCYNMTANAAAVLDVVKAGCSMWRCMLARDKCISTTFQNIPISLCCCSTDRCNVAENGIGGGSSRQSIGFNNAEPNSSGSERPKDDISRRLSEGHIDDDLVPSSGRHQRHAP